MLQGPQIPREPRAGASLFLGARLIHAHFPLRVDSLAISVYICIYINLHVLGTALKFEYSLVLQTKGMSLKMLVFVEGSRAVGEGFVLRAQSATDFNR